MREEDRSEGVRKGRAGRKVVRVLAFVFLGVIVAALFALVFGFVVQWLWNWLMPAIFGLRRISYWQAFGLLLLAKLFFGRLGHHAPRHRHGHHSGKGFFHGHHGHHSGKGFFQHHADLFGREKGERECEGDQRPADDARERSPD